MFPLSEFLSSRYDPAPDKVYPDVQLLIDCSGCVCLLRLTTERVHEAGVGLCLLDTRSFVWKLGKFGKHVNYGPSLKLTNSGSLVDFAGWFEGFEGTYCVVVRGEPVSA